MLKQEILDKFKKKQFENGHLALDYDIAAKEAMDEWAMKLLHFIGGPEFVEGGLYEQFKGSMGE